MGGTASSHPPHNKTWIHPDSSWIRPDNPSPNDPPTTRTQSLPSPPTGPYRPHVTLEDEQDRNATAASSAGDNSPPKIRTQSLPAPFIGPYCPRMMTEDEQNRNPTATSSSSGIVPSHPLRKTTMAPPGLLLESARRSPAQGIQHPAPSILAAPPQLRRHEAFHPRTARLFLALTISLHTISYTATPNRTPCGVPDPRGASCHVQEGQSPPHS